MDSDNAGLDHTALSDEQSSPLDSRLIRIPISLKSTFDSFRGFGATPAKISAHLELEQLILSFRNSRCQKILRASCRALTYKPVWQPGEGFTLNLNPQP